VNDEKQLGSGFVSRRVVLAHLGHSKAGLLCSLVALLSWMAAEGASKVVVVVASMACAQVEAWSMLVLEVADYCIFQRLAERLKMIAGAERLAYK